MGNDQSAPSESVSLGDRRYIRAGCSADADVTAFLLCLHGRGGTGLGFRKSVGHQFESTPGLLVVYPDGLARGWNDGRHGASVTSSADDVAFLTALINGEKERCPSIRRVCCTGMSNGAFMTFAMMRDPTGLIDCFAPVCGLLPKWSAPLALPPHAADGVSVVLIVGLLDKLVPVCGGAVGRVMRSEQSLQGGGLQRWEVAKERKQIDARGEVSSLHDTTEALKAMLGVELGEAVRLAAETRYTAMEQASANGRLRVITVEETGHQWPGSVGIPTKLPLTGKTATFSAGAEILKTFLR
eukprot:m.90865 g.90865  ORF g.90865 m.90865 type:complete len:298 (+) comp11894_c0_seq1:57-950(+)